MENRNTDVAGKAKVTFIEDSKRIEMVGGVGGFLRYRISAENAVPYEQGDSVRKESMKISA